MQKRPGIRVTGPCWSEYPEALDFERARLYCKDIRERIHALEFMENAREIWEEIGLAVRGEHHQTGKKLARQRKQL